METQRKPTTPLLRAAIAAAALFYVIRLSASDRTAIDWAVLALLAGVLLWNLVQLLRRPQS